MFLSELVKYYEIISDDEKSDLAKFGFNSQPVSYIINLDGEGKFLNIIPNKTTSGKKAIPKNMIVPEQGTRSGKTPKPYFLCDYGTYVLGIDKPVTDKNTKEITHKFSFDKFKCFKDYNISILNKAKCNEAKAVINFLNSWNSETEIDNEEILNIESDIYNSRFVFSVDYKVITEIEEIKNIWLSEYNNSDISENEVCLVTGNKGKVARLHPSFKNLIGATGSGAMIVSFNNQSFKSYGKKQGDNAPVGQYAAFAYGTALKKLLENNEHQIRIGDVHIVFWAVTKEKKIANEMFLLLNPDSLNIDESEKSVRDIDSENNIKKYFENVANGKPTGIPSFEYDTEICIMGISASKARASVRFFYKNSFGTFAKNMLKFYNELKLIKSSNKDMDIIPLWRIMYETLPKESKDKKPEKALSMAMLNSIIKGIRFPNSIYNNILLRIRKDKDINYYRMAMIKAYLLRNINDINIKEVLTVSINNNTDNKAYLLGNLFAVLEKLQVESAKTKLNTTIKDRYFSAACERPGSIFPKLLLLSNYHIKRFEYGYRYEKMKTDLISKIEYDNVPFPARLSKAEQGVFILGYYHKKNDLYTKKEDK